MSFPKAFILLILFTVLFSACDKEDDSKIDPSATVVGEWQVTTVKTTLENNGSSPQVNDLDLSNDGVTFKFNADGTYSTNANINLTSITKADNIFESTYKYSNEVIELDYFLADFNIRVKFNFKVNELQTNTMSMSLDEGSLLDAFNASIGQLSGANQIVAQLLISNIVDFEALINLKK